MDSADVAPPHLPPRLSTADFRAEMAKCAEVMFVEGEDPDTGQTYELPVVFDEHGVIEPIAYYLHYRRTVEVDASSSLRVYAYVLRELFMWFRAHRLSWLEVSDPILRRWLGSQKHHQGKRLQFKVWVVFDFYYRLQQRGYLTSVAGATSAIVGVGQHFPIQAEVVELRLWRDGTPSHKTSKTLVPLFASPPSEAEPKARRRPTPTREEVTRFLDLVLAAKLDEFCAYRTWFWASFMALVGLRAQGVASLGLSHLEAALHRVGICVPRPTSLRDREQAAKAGWRPQFSPLVGLAFWPNGQRAVVDGLLNLGSDYLLVRVVEKGSKPRDVRVPCILFREVLRRWVWDLHARFVTERLTRKPGWTAPDSLWLSKKTGQAISKRTIGNYLKKVFIQAAGPTGVALSGHRLRAFYLTHLVRSLYLEALAIQGKLVDIESILTKAAQLAGHEKPSTLRAYLEPEATWDLPADGHAILITNSGRAALLRGIARSLDEGDARLQQELEKVCRRLGVQSIPDVSTALDAVEAMKRHEARRASRGSA